MDHPSHIFHPSRVVVRGFYGVPTTPAFSMRVVTEALISKAIANKLWRGVRRFDLRPFDPDDLSGRVTRAISLDYDPWFDDRFNRQRNWSSIISPEERKVRETELAEYRAQRQELLDKPTKDRTDDDKAKLADLEDLIRELDGNTPGYLEEIPDAFGDGVSGLYHSLMAPNVPTFRRSGFDLGSDTPWCLRLYLYKPHEDQADYAFTVSWSRFRLVISETKITFVAFKAGLTPAQIEEKEAQLKTLQDKGRITLEDKTFKAQKKRAIADIKTRAKTAGRSGQKLSDGEKAQIKSIEDAIDARWDAKKLQTGADEERIKELEKELYVSRETCAFGQNFETFFNTPLVFSFFPQRRGFLSIQLEGAQSWSHEVREITETKRPGTLWNATRVTISTKGGAYKWNVGFPKARPQGLMQIGPVAAGYDLVGVPFTLTGQWDVDTRPGAGNLAASLTPAPKEMKEGIAAATPHLFSVNLFLTPGPFPEDVAQEKTLSGQRFPFLYDATLFIAAGARNGSDAVLFDTAQLDSVDGVAPVRDVKPTWDDRGALSCAVSLRNVENETGLTPTTNGFLDPIQLEGRLCDLYIDAVGNGATPFLARGLIRQPQIIENEISFTVTDHFVLLDDIMRARPIGDGLDLAVHLKQVLSCRGEKESELRGIPASLERKLSQASVGDDPANRPAEGTTYARYVDETLQTQATTAGARTGSLDVLRLRWAGDALGGFWAVEAPDTTVAFVDNGGGLLVEANFEEGLRDDDRLFIRDFLELPDDDSELSNIFTVEGARDPKTKEPFRATYVVWESLLVEEDLRFVGREKPAQSIRAANLQSEDECRRAAMAAAGKGCRGKKFLRVKMAFFRELRHGKIIRVNGLKCELVRATSASMADDEMEWLCLRLE